MNLHHLELFYHVARSGGISRAARGMPYGIQQPAISIQIRALEERLGTKLFDRQPFRLTADGRELYDFIRPFFDNVDAMAERLTRRRSPTFRIAASELVLRDYLPGVLQALKGRHPDLRFQLRSGLEAEIERLLHDGEIDLAIAPLENKPRAGVKHVSLVKLPLVLLVPKGSPVRVAADLWGQDRISETLVCLPAAESIAKRFQTGLRQLKVEWPTGIEASSTDLVTQYVANGYGIGVTVDLPATVSHRRVRAIPLSGFDPVEIVALWCPPSGGLHEEVRSVILERARELFPRKER